MKAHQESEPSKPFRPVTLVLETQQEVDAVYSLLNHVDLREAVGLPLDRKTPLREFRDCNRTNNYHEALRSLL